MISHHDLVRGAAAEVYRRTLALADELAVHVVTFHAGSRPFIVDEGLALDQIAAMMTALRATGCRAESTLKNMIGEGNIRLQVVTILDNIRRSLQHGFYQSWDLHPAQLPARYAAVYAFFLESLPDAARRLNAFLDRAAQATLVGNTFDDAATGQGLLNFFLRGLACGALTEAETLATGITLEELRGRSFAQIAARRAGER